MKRSGNQPGAEGGVAGEAEPPVSRWVVYCARKARQVVVLVIGGTVVVLGVVMLVTPGPAMLVIPLGLIILGTEFAWARRWLRQARTLAHRAVRAGRRRRDHLRPGSRPGGNPRGG